MTSRPASASDSIPHWLLMLLAVAWILPGLIGHEPWIPDEAFSFGLVCHILQTGDWVVPTLDAGFYVALTLLFTGLTAQDFCGRGPAAAQTTLLACLRNASVGPGGIH